MQKTIEALFDGSLFPHENMRPRAASYRKKLEELHSLQKQLSAALSPGQAELLREYSDKNLEVLSCDVTQAFVEGFRLGARLLAEALEDPCAG